ncbi:WYL domain-containing protein [Flavisolibacter sp. BT320]|nr:WYL domain-containing protein [Flavisolibacter longurius]
MPKSKDFYRRIELIDACFRQKGKKWDIDTLKKAINKKLENSGEETISKRTLQYALAYLMDEKGAPIVKRKEGATVYYAYSDVNYSIKNLPLSDEEIILLKDAVEVIKQIGNTSMAKDAAAIIAKLENTIAQNPVSDRTIIQFEKHTTAVGLEHLDDLFTSIKEKIPLIITYQPFGKESYEQLVHPYLLKEYRNRWFLLVRDDTYNTLCNLALDRIKNIKPAKTIFKENNLFDPNTYFNNLIGVTIPVGEEVNEIILKVKPPQVPYIKTKPIHFNQETEQLDDGSLLVKLKLYNNYELRSVLLGYGADIEVLQPALLCEQMKNVFQCALALYI